MRIFFFFFLASSLHADPLTDLMRQYIHEKMEKAISQNGHRIETRRDGNGTTTVILPEGGNAPITRKQSPAIREILRLRKKVADLEERIQVLEYYIQQIIEK